MRAISVPISKEAGLQLLCLDSALMNPPFDARHRISRNTALNQPVRVKVFAAGKMIPHRNRTLPQRHTGTHGHPPVQAAHDDAPALNLGNRLTFSQTS